MTPVIETFGLAKRYGSHRGIEEVTLSVEPGEVFGFLGPNGAGKSTTIHLLVGQLRPSSGWAHVLGLDSWRDRDAIAHRIGFLPGEFSMYERLTGDEMLGYLASLRGGVRRATIDALAERFQAELDRPIGTLSMGNKQKIGLVQAFMGEPDVVILDEPTLGLDPLVQREFHRLVDEVRAAGRTVFLSSHTLSEIERMADRVGIIREGSLVEVAEVSRLEALALRRIDIEFPIPADRAWFEHVEGVRQVDVSGRIARLEVEGDLQQLMKVAADIGIVDLHTHEADLEEIFLTYYVDRATPAEAAP